MPSSSSSRRRRRRRGGRRGRNSAAPAAAEEDARNWAELPLDAIRQRRRRRRRMRGTGRSCRWTRSRPSSASSTTSRSSWGPARCAAPGAAPRATSPRCGAASTCASTPTSSIRSTSTGWRRPPSAAARGSARPSGASTPETTTSSSSSATREIFISQFPNFTAFTWAPSLKSLHLISCYDVSNEGFAEAIKKLSLLELELSLCKNVCEKDVFETVGKACPHLKRFRLSEHGFYSFEDSEYNKDGVAMGIATMTELRSLQLFGNTLTNEGLTAILDNCPHLESLDIRHCFNVNMDDTLRAKCARIKTLRLPHDSTDDYEFQVQNPVWADSSDDSEDLYGDYMGSAFYYDLDSENYDDYCDPSRYLHGVYEDELDEESRMILRGMRALLK